MEAFSKNIYQIYPLGAAGAPFANDHQLTHRLGRFENWVDHLKAMNMDMVLFNPLFQSSTHGYDTIDYYQVDNRLGDQDDLIHLMNTLHDHGIQVLFDAVFNHVGREFAPFQDVLQNRENSRYKDWFTINFQGDNSYHDGLWYANWEGYDELVALNLKNPEVVNYLLGVVDFWIDTFGVDGLRLDVAYCLEPEFLKTLHNHVKTRNPEFFLLGETLHGDYNQWVNDQMLDSCTNYECYKGLYSSFNTKNFYEILYSLNRQFGNEQWCLYTGKHLLSFVDNHDVSRIATILEDQELLPCVYAMLMTMPGIPAVYYGSEWGMEGDKKDGDPGLRREVVMPEFNELSKVISRLAAIRKERPELIDGSYRQIAINNPWCVYERAKGDQAVWTAINITDQEVSIPVPLDETVVDLMTGEPEEIHGQLVVPAKSFKLIG